MNAHQFAAKWKPVTLTEVSAYQQHFLDLCHLLGEKTPAEADPTGTSFTFQKGVTKSGGGKGFADVWRRGCFGWEYKGKHKDLRAAYDQLLQYREALENPPLLVVCDLDRFVLRTNFTGFAPTKHEFDLDALAADPKWVDLLRRAFADPYSLKPDLSQEQVTADIADRFSKLADGMRARGVPPDAAAHFLMKLMFCMFAEDIGLLPRELFTRTVANSVAQPARLSKLLANLFQCMKTGDPFGADDVYRFNGRLFEEPEVVELTAAEAAELLACARCDWSAVEPSVFGTLFERCLDPAKRGQLGAHYTGRADIEALLTPVLLAPLRREWDAARAEAEAQWDRSKRVTVGEKAWKDARAQFDGIVRAFLHRLAGVTVLDPACGSGNFLYVALHMLLDLEKEVLTYAESRDPQKRIPLVRPTQLKGLEVNVYARELAQVVIWIGFHQWMRFNGFVPPTDPVLQPMDSIRWQDAVLNRSDPENVRETDWPDAEFVVGNPPFLGNKLMRSKLGGEYVEQLWGMYGDRLPAMSDLCAYWFEKARAMIEQGRAKRAGLLATTGIKQVGGRRALERIAETQRIFFAESDRPWVLDGAAVRIVMVGFGAKGDPDPAVLDGKPVAEVHADLTAGLATAAANRLADNAGRAFMGTTKVGDFDIPLADARKMLADPNPHGRPNSEVLRPWANGSDLVRVPSNRWIIDYGATMPEEDAALYAAPFGHLVRHVRAGRQKSGQADNRTYWWIHGRPRPALRTAVAGLTRYIGTARVAKHRLFVWLDTVVLPDSKVIAVAYDDDFHFGVLHSRVHDIWSLKMGSKHGGERPTYNPDLCFLTFPFPEPTDAQREAVAAAAKQLDALRSNWLNPPEWTKTEVLTFPGSADGPWRRYVTEVDPARGVGTVRYPRLVPKDAASAAELKKRTLTNLYNKSEPWLTALHRKLDEAVFAAYGWPPDLPDDDLLARLLALNLARAGSSDAATPADDGDE